MKSKLNTFRPVLVLAPGVLAGAEKVVLTGLNALSELGLNPLMIIIRETRAPQFAEDFKKMLPVTIESKIIDSTKAFDLKLPQKLAAELKKEKLPVVLHSHGFKALIACYMAREKRPHLHTHHGNTAHTFKVRLYEKLAMMTMKKCSQVIAVSPKMQTDLESALSPYKKIVFVENMLSLSNAEKIREERKKVNLASKEKINLIFVGRLSPEKGLLTFMECFASFQAREQFHLTVLGDGVEKSKIEKLILDNNLSSIVTMHGFVADPATYFINADVLIMPSLREGLPMTLLEALASGIPVIANNVGAISSLVNHDHNGYFSKDISIQSWTETLDATLKNAERWKKNATVEAIEIERRFSAELWAKKTLELYLSNLN